MTSLTAAEVQALHDALDDEYHAAALYSQVMNDFGTVRPFLNIRDSELRHIEALLHLFERYSLPVPANPWITANLPHFTSLKEACEAGVQAEIENVTLYERILNSTSRADLLQVFLRLQAASQERHLPAFQRAQVRLSEGRGSDAGTREPQVGCGAGRQGRHGRRGWGGRRRSDGIHSCAD
jgi:hypothetical protein